MQKGMDEKNRSALLEWGPRKILGELANVPSLDNPNWGDSVAEFIGKYGELLQPIQVSPLQGSEIAEYAARFRVAWEAKSNPELLPAFNASLNEIFAPGDPIKGERAVFSADFELGRWRPEARTLLDALAIELMRSRKMLHRCERPECKRYFVKEFSRDRYCSRPCGEVMRERGQTQWAVENRDKINSKRRKPQKKSRNGNSA